MHLEAEGNKTGNSELISTYHYDDEDRIPLCLGCVRRTCRLSCLLGLVRHV